MPKTILAIDDSASMRQLVSFALKNGGYDVIDAADGQEGLDKARGRKFDLILTDQNMPRMDGITLIKNVRALPQHKSTPVLMLTTENSESMRSAGKAAGATGWMTKPFDPPKLVEVVKRCIG